MSVLVTGANGFLGQHIVNALLTQSFEVKIIVRSTTDIYFNLSNVQVYIGDFTDPLDLQQAIVGCDSVIHCASTTSVLNTDYFEFQRVNVEASKKLLGMVELYGLKSVVYISTSNTIGNGTINQLATEVNTIDFPFNQSFYAKSKSESEDLFVHFAIANPSVHVIILNPCFMIGSLDIKPSSGRLVLMGMKRILLLPSGGKNFVSVNYVADIAVLALTQGQTGEKYLLGDQNMNFKLFFKKLADLGGYFQIRIVLPNLLLKILGFLGDILCLLNIQVEYTSVNIQQLLTQEYYSGKKAQNEFKKRPNSLSKSMVEAIDWFAARKI